MSTVSIILPTYNREKFLPEAFTAIASQAFTDWELIVVDDGSTDGTRDLVPRLTAGFAQPVRYIYQENQGAYGARNTGLDHATGKYIAFYDSDDLWLPHHLQDCVAALDENSDVDWVYSATRMVDHGSGKVLVDNAFYEGGLPRPFVRLRGTVSRPRLDILESDEAILVALTHALYAGLQSSLIRRNVFKLLRLPAFRVGEDQVFTVLALKSGYRLAYINRVHVEYRMHSDGVSVGNASDRIQAIGASKELLRAFEWLREAVPLSGREWRALNRRLAREYFWNVGYRLQECGVHDAAQEMFRKGIRYSPWNCWLWKTYAASFLKRCTRSDNYGPSVRCVSSGSRR